MKRSIPPFLSPMTYAMALFLMAVLIAACDLDSVDSTTAVVSDSEGNIYDYSGMYMSASNANGSTNGYSGLVFPAGKQSGVTLTWMRLLQYGNILEAYDNAGMNWDGGISAQNGETASFNLQGRTTAGAVVEIAGTLTYVSQLSTMDATWIEPTFAGSIFAQATVSPVVTNSPITTLSITPSSASFSTNDLTESFSAVGGTSPYSWTVSDSSRGSVSPDNGQTVEYASTHVVGNNTITVTDANGNTATATATYSSSGPSNVSISPDTLSLNASKFIGTFTASGGNGTFTWMVTDESLGTVSPSSGSSTTYTSKKVAGTNTITVIDSDNRTDSATAIYQ